MSQISIGYVIGSIVAGLFVLVGVALFLFGWIFSTPEAGDDRVFLRMTWGAGVITVLAAAGIWIGTTWPSFDLQYHSWRPVSGTVAEIGTRLLGSDKSTDQVYAVRLVEDATVYRCDDTRCSLVHAGDRIRLRCIREWQYASTSGWRCRYVGSDAGPAK